MHARINGEPLEEMDCFKYLGWQGIEVAQGCGAQNQDIERVER